MSVHRSINQFMYALPMVFLPFLLALGGNPTPAYAYNLDERGYWYSMMNVRYCNYGTGNSNSNWNHGITAWNQDANAPVFLTSNCTNSDIDLFADNYGNNSTPGITYFATSKSGTCNGWTQFGYNYSYLNTYYTDNIGNPTPYYDSNADQMVAVHELGHGIGLDHVNITSSVMQPTTGAWFTYHINTPQPDDENGVRALYNACGYH